MKNQIKEAAELLISKKPTFEVARAIDGSRATKPSRKQLRELASRFSKPEWDFLCDLDIFNHFILTDIKAARLFAANAILMRTLEIADGKRF